MDLVLNLIVNEKDTAGGQNNNDTQSICSAETLEQVNTRPPILLFSNISEQFLNQI